MLWGRIRPVTDRGLSYRLPFKDMEAHNNGRISSVA